MLPRSQGSRILKLTAASNVWNEVTNPVPHVRNMRQRLKLLEFYMNHEAEDDSCCWCKYLFLTILALFGISPAQHPYPISTMGSESHCPMLRPDERHPR
jgi:hypothetical protein